jgi:hypothetical protein
MMPVAVVIPEKPRGSLRSWRRLITAVRDGARNSLGMDGQWLDGGASYEVPAASVILACDRFPGQRNVRMYVPDPGARAGLRNVKAWDLKAPLGKRVTGFVDRRLAPGASGHKAVLLGDLPNRYDGTCMFCRQPVARHAGILARTRADGRGRVAHRKGECPPPVPAPERTEPNLYPGACVLCGAWVAEGTGAAVLAPSPERGSEARYQPVHTGGCPPPPPGPVNARDGWCSRCCERVGAGEGCWLPGPGGAPGRILSHHYPACPHPPAAVPTWVVRVREGRPAAGDVIRARIDTRDGGPVIAPETPGYRVLSDATGYTQIYGYVTGTWPSPWRARVRACTEEEAGTLLAEDVLAVLAVTRHGPGFRAVWTAEQIGPRKPWVAELTGWSPSYGYQRSFLRPKTDYSGANRAGTRGVKLSFTLRLDTVYEAWRMTSWTGEERLFLLATPGGDVRCIGREEAEAWLSVPSSAR